MNGHDQVVVELDPTDDFQLFIRALESLRDGTVFEVRGVHFIESVGDFFAPLGIASDLIRLRVNEIASTLSLFKLMNT